MATSNSYEYINERSINEELLCSICTDPFEDPLCANQCGHTFCRKCITDTFCRKCITDTFCRKCITDTFRDMSRCPTCRHDLKLEDFHPVTIRPFLNQLNQLLVKCKWCSQSNIERGNFKDHLSNCVEEILSCPAANLKCDWKGKRDKIQDHVSICPLIKVQPMIVELTDLVKQQSEQIRCLDTLVKQQLGQIRFLYTILETQAKHNQ
ncbi:unnamed protein product [Rotaria sp. Silwood1]|nr:unnamed protein product [Rotaria sp. Silwood1]CAF1412429.1 unnamed protein product [Rotaria sp. Silwood1]CAF3578855.1 unnamed protein product [Rotaria sp. Silwood1]CAF3580965.1 unnamed protein product [Rotaria sp. Silwood1]CAF3609833.1 unnamed protein product [Rotaria sp. Silwood1]